MGMRSGDEGTGCGEDERLMVGTGNGEGVGRLVRSHGPGRMDSPFFM